MEQTATDFATYAREKLGCRVNVKFDFTPWGTYYTRVTSIVTAKSSEVDIIFADSQWLGELYEGGHIISIKDFILEDPELRFAVLNDTFENLIYFYTAYPQGSDNYVAIPGYADATLYRITEQTSSLTRMRGPRSKLSTGMTYPLL